MIKQILVFAAMGFFLLCSPIFASEDAGLGRIEEIQKQMILFTNKVEELRKELEKEKAARKAMHRELKETREKLLQKADITQEHHIDGMEEASRVFMGFTIGGDGNVEYYNTKNTDADEDNSDQLSYFMDELNIDLDYSYESIQAHLDLLVSKGVFAGDRENNDHDDHRWNDGYWVFWNPSDEFNLKFGDFATNLGKSIIIDEQEATFEVGTRYRDFLFSFSWILKNESGSTTTDEHPDASDKDYDIFIISGGGDLTDAIYGGFWGIYGNDASTETEFYTVGFALQEVFPSFYQLSCYLEADLSRRTVPGQKADRGYAVLLGATLPIGLATFGTEVGFGSGDDQNTVNDESWLGISNDFEYDLVWGKEIMGNGLANKIYIKPTFQFSLLPNINTSVAVILDWFGKQQVNPATGNSHRFAGTELDIDNQYILANNFILGAKGGVFFPGSYYDNLLDESAYVVVGYVQYKFLSGAE